MAESSRICDWAVGSDIERKYHDNEWSVENHDERYLFEMLILEGAQAGLSWITILKKRDNYKKAYDNFEPSIVAKYDEDKIEELMQNEGIVRNRRKIASSIKNAKEFLNIQKEFGSFDKYIWSFTNNEKIVNNWENIEDVPASSELSVKISKDLKKRGFNFVGDKIIYSYLQAIGVIDDHLVYCKYKTKSQ
ncbi:DNA-3-methyladenine glycosylase I [Miniphocaeibacter massiliensis]|uniref:DNA-3-methyladenine glycosylase I n=1 Tax=Miniphocaeibacter massiliensis TaxID=2041841 RepID=UPI000C1C16EA|nr:DNA-3-methyladenine glycosylase I [Miniphocaeibacter massiliensis]